MNFSEILQVSLNEKLFVIDKSIAINNYVKIDLSVTNKELQSINITSAKEFEAFIGSYLQKHNAKVAFGGYLEERNIYNRSANFNVNNTENNRNIHLGMDFWCKKNTYVLAVLDGEVHSFKNNAQVADYGPTIILKHTVDTTVFYSLYGHLSIASLKNLQVGKKVKKGEIIGAIGSAEVNGDYAPHLHFQLIKDIQDNFGDYAGVCSKARLDFYKENCPDPNLLLKL